MSVESALKTMQAALTGEIPARKKKLSGAARRRIAREAARRSQTAPTSRGAGRTSIDLPLPTTCPRTAKEIAEALQGLFHVGVMAVRNPDLEPQAAAAARAAFIGNQALKATVENELLENDARIAAALESRRATDASAGALSHQPDDQPVIEVDREAA